MKNVSKMRENYHASGNRGRKRGYVSQIVILYQKVTLTVEHTNSDIKYIYSRSTKYYISPSLI